MVDVVNRLIFNTLISGNDIYLPQVGSLVIRRRTATMQGAKRLIPPCRKVTFTGEQRGESLVDLIQSVASVSQTRAEDIYRQWLQSVSRDGVVTIDGVGVVAQRNFAIDAKLNSILNPHSLEPLVLKPRISASVYVAVLLLLLSLGFGGYLLLDNGAQESDMELMPQEVAIVEMAPQNAVVTADVVIEPAVEPVADSLATNIVTVEPIAQSEAVEQIDTLKANYSYIVWGVYSKIENARNYKELVEQRFEDLHCTIYHYKNNTMYMVALDVKPSRGQSIAVMRELKQRSPFFDQLWIFTNK